MLSSQVSRCGATPRRGARTGFSLIEMLVVIAVIAILGTIIIVGLSRARDLANTTKCAQQMRTLSTGFSLYAQEHKQILPILDGNNEASWINSIVPYLGGEDLVPVYFRHNIDAAYCPTFIANATGSNVRVANGLASSYTANASLMAVTVLPNQNSVRQTAISDPTKTMLLVDGIHYPNGRAGVFFPRQLKPQSEGGFIGFWHQDRANFLFMDGHVDSLTKDEIEDNIYVNETTGRLF